MLDTSWCAVGEAKPQAVGSGCKLWAVKSTGGASGTRRCAWWLVFVFELGFAIGFGVFVDHDFVGLELVGVAG